MGTGDPHLLSAFPTLARRGTRVRVELRGHDLAAVSEPWLDDAGIAAKVAGPAEPLSGEESRLTFAGEGKKRVRMPRMALDLEIGPQARLGGQLLRVVSSRGI